MVAPLYRIAFLEADVHVADRDLQLERTLELLLWIVLFETCVRHPSLSVMDPQDMEVLPLGGQYVPLAALRGEGRDTALFSWERRDELAWLETDLRTECPGPLTLHTHRADGSVETFHALGPSLGEQLESVLSSWFGKRGIAALPKSIEPFTATDLVDVARVVGPVLDEAARGSSGWGAVSEEQEAAADELDSDDESTSDESEEPEDAEPLPVEDESLSIPELPAVAPLLRVCALRAFEVAVGIAVSEQVLALDSENPAALRGDFLSSLNQDRDYALIRRCLAAAPGWGKPYLSLFVREEDTDQDMPGKPSELEELGAFGGASFCLPSNPFALCGYAARLAQHSRHQESQRYIESCLAVEPGDPARVLDLLECYGELEQFGTGLRVAAQAADRVGRAGDGELGLSTVDAVRIELAASTALLNVGRLGEAIALRSNQLAGLEADLPEEVAQLDHWRGEPRFVAWCYAREGHYRGDDGRVLSGLARAEPDDGFDLGIFLESLLACGREEEALLAWAEYGNGRGLKSPFACLLGSRTLLACQRWVEGFEERLRARLRNPDHVLCAAQDRTGRLFASAPLAPLEGLVCRHLKRGAMTLARLYAREIADFVPGAGRSTVIVRALERGSSIVFQSAWLAAFAPNTPSRRAIDALFQKATEAGDTLESADLLVARWPEVVHTEVGSEDDTGLAQATLYIFAQALVRYFAHTSGAPGLVGGALRVVAGESLQALSVTRERLHLPDWRALLTAIEPTLEVTDPWVVDPWLMRIEQGLRLEERLQGRFELLTSGLPKVADHLRGPERLAWDTFTAATLCRTRPEGQLEYTKALLEQLVRLGVGAQEWAEAAVACGGGEEGLDSVLTAAWLTEGYHAAACVEGAKMLFARKQAEEAFDLLCRGLGPAGEDWRDEALAALKAPWKAAKLDVPFVFKKAASRLFEALQSGDAALAERLGRWLVALDSGNQEAHRNLGLAYARQGKVGEALAHLALAAPEQATQILAGVLHEAGHTPQALRVLDYACRWYARADQWLTYGGIAYAALDNPRTVRAYRNAYQLDPDAFDASQLNAFAGVLDEVGDWAECERIARHLLRIAGEDATWKSSGYYQLACAQIGLERFDDAIKHAKKAVKTNPIAENAEIFAVALRRAQARKPPEPVAGSPAAASRDPVWDELEQSDVQAVVKREADPSWSVQRAVLRAARFRYSSDNDVAVTALAQDLSARLLERSQGSDDPAACVCRVLALDVRAQARFPWDEPPHLGDRLTRQSFESAFRARGSALLGAPQTSSQPFVDRQVCPGALIPDASSYVALLLSLACHKPREAIALHGLTEESYYETARQWAEAIARDDTLAVELEARLRSQSSKDAGER